MSSFTFSHNSSFAFSGSEKNKIKLRAKGTFIFIMCVLILCFWGIIGFLRQTSKTSYKRYFREILWLLHTNMRTNNKCIAKCFAVILAFVTKLSMSAIFLNFPAFTPTNVHFAIRNWITKNLHNEALSCLTFLAKEHFVRFIVLQRVILIRKRSCQGNVQNRRFLWINDTEIDYFSCTCRLNPIYLWQLEWVLWLKRES
jgi:hypothetical protein